MLMIKKTTLSILFTIFIFSIVTSQNLELSAFLVPDELKENANSVIRFEDLHIDMTSQRDMTITKKIAITIFNKQADDNADISLPHNGRTIIKSVKVYYYDAFGKEIKKVKKKDFKDYSASGGLFSDGRYLYYSYTPTTYPYTVYYEYEIKTSNTAFIPQWFPLNSYYQSVQKSVYTFEYPSNIKLLKSENNFEGYDIANVEEAGKITYKGESIKAIEREPITPSFSSFVPNAKLGVSKFNLEGVNGAANNWQEFGKWYYENLIQSTLDLPEKTRNEIKSLTASIEDPIEKAKFIYKYVQDKVRYISVQIGVGGFKPMRASAVDNLSYGDCKALTNYTASLLSEVGIESYHALIYSGSGKKSINSDVVSQQGNHMVLYVPISNQELWLECTSQGTPFNDSGDFTDDRDALIITPDGGEIKHTRVYDDKENHQKIVGKYILSNEGHISAEVKMVSSGTQFDNHLGYEGRSNKELDKSYKEFWDNINNMTIDKIVVKNNKKEGKFEEDLSFVADNYGAVSGERMILPINAFNVVSYTPKRIRDRKLPVEITRGYYKVDVVIVELPSDYKIEAMTENIVIDSKYGEYKLTIEKQSENTLKYTREFLLKNGKYPKEEYKDYRSFRKKVVRSDKSKIVLIKK
ncbi:MAG: DUF3857 domain-containing protein [Lutibacter sp.]|nr:MAG: DUF3857 domain-containing protein [Lutibacter sp.]